MTLHKQFEEMCNKSNFESAKRMYFMDSNNKIDTFSIFINNCEKGNLPVATFIYEIDTTMQTSLFLPLLLACKNNRLNIVKWIVSINSNIIKKVCYSPFRTACYYGHLSIAKYLYSLGCNINEIDAWSRKKKVNNTFRSRCPINIIKWLDTIQNDNVLPSTMPVKSFEKQKTDEFLIKITTPDGYLTIT